MSGRSSRKGFTPSVLTYLGKPIGVRCQNSHISRLGIRIIYRNILFYRQVQFLFLLVRRGARIFSDMLAFDDMVDDSEGSAGRHGVIQPCLGQDRGNWYNKSDESRK